MNNKLNKMLDNLIDNQEQPNIENINLLVAEAMKMFSDVQEIIKSGDAEKRKTALEELSALKDRLEEGAKIACERSGMTPEKLMELMSNPKNFGESEWDLIKTMQNSFTDFNTNLVSEFLTKDSKTKKIKPKNRSKNQHLAV